MRRLDQAQSHFMMSDFELKILETCPVSYKCYRSRQRVERALLSLGADELEGILRDQGSCHLCFFRSKIFLTAIPMCIPFHQNTVPLSQEEVDKLGVESTGTVTVDYQVGDNVEITAGPLQGFIGLVEQLDLTAQKVQVKVSMFGRETPAELELNQVKPL